MIKWEYKSIKFEPIDVLNMEQFDSAINKYGIEGWEMVSCFKTNAGYGTTKYLVVVFKRQLN